MKPSEAIKTVVKELNDLFVTREDDIWIHVSKRDKWSSRLEEIAKQVEQLEAEILRLINKSIFGEFESFTSVEDDMGKKITHMKNEVEKLIKALKE